VRNGGAMRRLLRLGSKRDLQGLKPESLFADWIGPAEAGPWLQGSLRLGFWQLRRPSPELKIEEQAEQLERNPGESGGGLAVEEGCGEGAVGVDGDEVGGMPGGEVAGGRGEAG
jgi:hypothetical protein